MNATMFPNPGTLENLSHESKLLQYITLPLLAQHQGHLQLRWHLCVNQEKANSLQGCSPKVRGLATEPASAPRKRLRSSRQTVPLAGEKDLSPSTRHLCEVQGLTLPDAKSHTSPSCSLMIMCGCQLNRKRTSHDLQKSILVGFLVKPHLPF